MSRIKTEDYFSGQFSRNEREGKKSSSNTKVLPSEEPALHPYKTPPYYASTCIGSVLLSPSPFHPVSPRFFLSFLFFFHVYQGLNLPGNEITNGILELHNFLVARKIRSGFIYIYISFLFFLVGLIGGICII